ncbi:Leucine-rich repeat-containing protein 74B [Schistosoma japonicum]|nr:Leucine-rich repeat-containing protein 74B [Schistosoma japonicum]
MEVDVLNQEGEVSNKSENGNSITANIQKHDEHVNLTEAQDKSLGNIKALKSLDNSQIKRCKRLLSATNHWYTDPDQLEYMSECKSRGSPSSGYFLRHLKDENLSLKYSVLGLKKLKPIFSSISSSLNITQLDLSNAGLTNECVNHLCRMLHENTYITDLNLSENQFTSKSVEHLCEVLASSTELLRLNLRKNLFDDNAGKFFSELIASSLKLKYINISYNDLGELTCQYIGRALPQATTLTEFDLSWNRLGCGKMIYFTKGLAENKNLKYLNLSANGIGPKKGCTELAFAIRNNQTLQTLDLSDNRINPEGSVLLSKGFYVNSTLTCLRMARNPMQTAGCYAILTGILKNPNSGLMELDLQDFLELQDSARIKLPNLCVRYGHTTTDKMRVLSPRFKRPEYTPKQILIIMGHSTKQSLADLLRPLDTVGDKIVKRQVFVKILNRLGIHFTEEQMKLLMQELDPNNQEEINFT